MTLSSIQPPPHCGAENQEIPNEPIFPPNPNKMKPLAPPADEPTCVSPPPAGIVMVDKPRVMPSPVLSREEELYWLALKLVPGLGSRTSGKLPDRFRTPQAIFRASRTERAHAPGDGAGFRRRFRRRARRRRRRGAHSGGNCAAARERLGHPVHGQRHSADFPVHGGIAQRIRRYRYHLGHPQLHQHGKCGQWLLCVL
jgi:hypothetical protein